MLPLSLYPVLFSNEMLWYGDVSRSSFKRGNYMAEFDWLVKINSMILKKIGIDNVYYKSKDGNLKSILNFPFFNDGYVCTDVKKYGISKQRDYADEDRVINTSFFYIRTEERMSYWNLRFFDNYKLFDEVHYFYEIIRDGAERCNIDEEMIIDLYWDGMPFDLLEAYKNYHIVEEWCMDFGLDVIATRQLYKAVIDIYKVVKDYPREHFWGWFDSLYANAVEYDLDSWNTFDMFETMIISLPVLRDWRNFKLKNTVEDGDLEKRAEFLFSKLTSERDCKIWKTHIMDVNPDNAFLFPGENSSVHLSLYMKEVDEVVEQLVQKYGFTNKEKHLLNCYKDLKEVV